MAGTGTLSPTEREFFSLVARIVFTSPFSDERAEIDARISGGSPTAPHAERAARVMERVAGRVAELEEEGRAHVGAFQGADRETMAYVFLFEIYHRFKDDLDRLIVDQVEAGKGSLAVPFATDVLEFLRCRGFSREEALRNFGLFYQIRRAFFFIDHALLGESLCMKELRLALWNNIFTSDIRWYNRYLWNRMEDFSTLLLGETGSGKGSAAMAIGRSGFIPFDPKSGSFHESFASSFVSLNLSQFPEALIESELFGHKKGAFTGAVDDHAGIFATCSPYGAIFLDEIGEVMVPVQIKLLQVLEERIFTPVGSHEKLRFRGRVIAATNRPLEELRGEGLFRDDFFYRLCSDLIVVPPLRQRLAELPGELDIMVRHTVHRTLGEDAPEMVSLVLEAIQRQLGPAYAWPGNVRELEQCVRRILLKRHYGGDRETAVGDLRGELFRGIDAGELDASALLEGYCALLYRRHGSYEQVARRTKLDRRTVRKYVQRWSGGGETADDDQAE